MTDKHVNAVRERPILFSKSMVLALLAGTKTQTRRIVKPQPSTDGFTFDHDRWLNAWGEDFVCPYGATGDRLWVKETHARIEMSQFDMIAYRATAGEAMVKNVKKWTPSIFMPRKLSRITLEIESVRVERLQDISEEDAIAEGVEGWIATREPSFIRCRGIYNDDYHRRQYEDLWESINGPGSWALNSWVWVLQFRRLNPDPAKQ